MNKAGSNSIVILYLRSVFRLRWHWGNFLIPIIVGIGFGCLGLNSLLIGKRSSYLISTTYLLIGLNGAILGFVVAGFAIFASFSNGKMTVFSISNKRAGDHYSYLKTKLLTFFKSFFWVFVGVVGIVTIDALVRFYSQGNFQLFKTNSETVHNQLAFLSYFLLGYFQAKIFVELKCLIFTLYNSSLSQAKFMAQEEGVTPIDETND